MSTTMPPLNTPVGDYTKTHRTKAMPKTSLFGSVLERKEPSQYEGIDVNSVSIKHRPMRKPRSQIKLPDSLKAQLPSEDLIKQSKGQLSRQTKQTEQARELLSSLEDRAKFFKPKAVELASKGSSSGLDSSHSSRWISAKDLQHSEEINRVGLQNNSYNRQKYQRRPPVHQYSGMGDVFQPGMDFNNNAGFGVNPEPIVFNNPQEYWERRVGERLPLEKDNPIKEAVALPQNIRHRFGSKVCAQVLSDALKVHETMEQHEKIVRGPAPPRLVYKPRKLPPKEINPIYDNLGNSLRQNIFPGYSHGYKDTLTKDSYCWDVFDQRTKDVDSYRYQRDELSTWTENNVLHERMKKKWSEFEESQPKQEPNWDRNETRQIPKPNMSAKKPKVKARKKAKVVSPNDDKDRWDIEFKTPPLTPKVQLEKLPVMETEDDQFWGFYDQKIPS